VKPWLFVVGIGEDGIAGLSPAARALVNQGERLVGGARHLAHFADDPRPKLAWPRPLTDLVERIIAERRPTVVLASGDPMWFGIGATFAGRVAAGEMVVAPHASVFTLACARMRWSMAECRTLSAHGRPLAALSAALAPGAKILLLSEDGATPAAVAKLLRRRGYGGSAVTVLARLGGAAESVACTTASGIGGTVFDSCNTVAVHCIADDGSVTATAGILPDAAFRNDGQLTKRTVRAATVAALAPCAGQLLWDIGAGCGAVAIEWLRAANGAAAIAVERSADRAALAAANSTELGVPQLDIVQDEAPAALAKLAAPDAVFIGGGLSGGVLPVCHAALNPGGRLVANAVTLEGETILAAAQKKIGGELKRISVSHAVTIGNYRGWRAAMPVTQLCAVKT